MYLHLLHINRQKGCLFDFLDLHYILYIIFHEPQRKNRLSICFIWSIDCSPIYILMSTHSYSRIYDYFLPSKNNFFILFIAVLFVLHFFIKFINYLRHFEVDTNNKHSILWFNHPEFCKLYEAAERDWNFIVAFCRLSVLIIFNISL